MVPSSACSLLVSRWNGSLTSTRLTRTCSHSSADQSRVSVLDTSLFFSWMSYSSKRSVRRKATSPMRSNKETCPSACSKACTTASCLGRSYLNISSIRSNITITRPADAPRRSSASFRKDSTSTEDLPGLPLLPDGSWASRLTGPTANFSVVPPRSRNTEGSARRMRLACSVGKPKAARRSAALRRSFLGADSGTADATTDATTTIHAARSSSASSHASFSTIRCSRSPGLATGQMSTWGSWGKAEGPSASLRKIALLPEPRSPTMMDRRISKIASMPRRGTKLSSRSSSLSASSAPNLRSASRTGGERIRDTMTSLTASWRSATVSARLSSTTIARTCGASRRRRTSSSVIRDFEASVVIRFRPPASASSSSSSLSFVGFEEVLTASFTSRSSAIWMDGASVIVSSEPERSKSRTMNWRRSGFPPVRSAMRGMTASGSPGASLRSRAATSSSVRYRS